MEIRGRAKTRPSFLSPAEGLGTRRAVFFCVARCAGRAGGRWFIPIPRLWDSGPAPQRAILFVLKGLPESRQALCLWEVRGSGQICATQGGNGTDHHSHDLSDTGENGLRNLQKALRDRKQPQGLGSRETYARASGPRTHPSDALGFPLP